MKKIRTYTVCLLALGLCFASCKKDEETVQQRPVVDSQPAEEEEVVVEPIVYPAGGNLVMVIDSAAMTLDEFSTQVTSTPLMAYATYTLGDAATTITNGLQSLVTARRPVLNALFAKNLGYDKRNQWQIETYVFSYTSTTPTGEPVTLSGRVTFPNNTVDGVTHQLESYSLYSHQFVYSNTWAPSQGFSLMSMRALWNSAVIEPDEQGLGIDNGHHAVIYISSEVRGRQLADCAKAAREVMRRHGVELSADGYTTNWGDSFAACAAMGYARYYDLYASAEERAAMRLKSTFAANGPYIYDELLTYKNDHFDYNSVLTLMLFSLHALDSRQLRGYAPEDFAPAWLLDNKMEYNGKEYTMFYAASYSFEDYITPYFEKYQDDGTLRHIVASDMLFDDGHFNYNNDKTKALLGILHEQSNFDGWRPATDIYMAHAEDDEVTPYSKVQDLYSDLSNRGGGARQKMHWLDAKPYSTDLQQSMGIHNTISIEAMIWMVLAKEPKDMALFYN